jgi:DNA polymerase III subunit beta
MEADLLKLGFQNIAQITNSPILFSVKDNILHLAGHSDTVTVSMIADVDHPDFHYVLPPEHARQISKSLKSGSVVSISSDEDNLVITSGKSKVTYTTMPIESISYKLLMRNYKEDFYYSLDSKDLVKAFQSVLPFSSSDVDDLRVKNIHFSIENGQVEVAASNSFTVAMYTFPAEKSYNNGDIPLAVVVKSFAFLTKAFGDTIHIGMSDKKIYFKGVDKSFTYRISLPVVDIPPFPYRALFTKLSSDTNFSQVVLDKEEFIEVAKNFLYFTDEDVRSRVTLNLSHDNVNIRGNNNKGMFDVDIKPISSNSTEEILVSLDYLLKSANSINSDSLTFTLVDNKVLMRDNNFSVIVPRLRN